MPAAKTGTPAVRRSAESCAGVKGWNMPVAKNGAPVNKNSRRVLNRILVLYQKNRRFKVSVRTKQASWVRAFRTKRGVLERV